MIFMIQFPIILKLQWNSKTNSVAAYMVNNYMGFLKKRWEKDSTRKLSSSHIFLERVPLFSNIAYIRHLLTLYGPGGH